MNDPEVKAISDVTKALDELSEEQRRNVLLYVNARYGVKPAVAHPQSVGDSGSAAANVSRYASIGDFFDAANPQTEAERVLVAAYWIQVVEGAEDFESFPVNKHLKHLGHPVSNITRAFDSMIAQTPRLILQTSKSGSSQQARKRYKVTREGVKRVQAMLNQQTDGGGDGN
ncbi:hypothetical protein J4558_17655 [Leptolyngbya sp. 15MV]|nr:hypothetical protein J4558_17655 [Leptolyngbya sp. 15MV]